MEMDGKKERAGGGNRRARKDEDEDQKQVGAESTLKSKAWKALPAILAPLKTLPHWVVWRYEQIKQGKPTKIPYQPKSPKLKAANDKSSSWASYEVAVAAAAKGFDGIGFVLTDTEFAAFDIDDCPDPNTGEIHPWAQRLVERVKAIARSLSAAPGCASSDWAPVRRRIVNCRWLMASPVKSIGAPPATSL